MSYSWNFITDDMEFYGPGGVLLDHSTVVRGFQIYDTVCDRIATQWKPEACPIDKFKKDHFEQLCTAFEVASEDKRLYVSNLSTWITNLRFGSLDVK